MFICHKLAIDICHGGQSRVVFHKYRFMFIAFQCVVP